MRRPILWQWFISLSYIKCANYCSKHESIQFIYDTSATWESMQEYQKMWFILLRIYGGVESLLNTRTKYLGN